MIIDLDAKVKMFIMQRMCNSAKLDRRMSGWPIGSGQEKCELYVLEGILLDDGARGKS